MKGRTVVAVALAVLMCGGAWGRKDGKTEAGTKLVAETYDRAGLADLTKRDAETIESTLGRKILFVVVTVDNRHGEKDFEWQEYWTATAECRGNQQTEAANLGIDVLRCDVPDATKRLFRGARVAAKSEGVFVLPYEGDVKWQDIARVRLKHYDAEIAVIE